MKLLGSLRKPKDYVNFDKEINAYLKGEFKPKPIDKFKLSEYDDVIKMLEKLSASDKPQDFAISEKARELLEIQPKNELTNIFQQNLKSNPTDFDKAKFLSLLNVVSDPNVIFTNMVDGTLSFRDVDNLAINHPDFHDTLNYSIVDVVSDYLSKNDYYGLTTQITLMLAKILGIDTLAPSRIKAVQDSYAKKPAENSTQIEVPMDSVATELNQAIENA